MPRNLIVMNPMVSSANVVQDRNWTKFNSLQLELRRRFTQGLLVGANYTYGIKKQSLLTTLARDRVEVDISDDRNSPHAFKMNWTYELPIGRGRRFGTDINPIVHGIVGDWEFSGAGIVKTDRYRITGVKLEGMTADDFADEFKIRIERNAAGNTVVYSMPDDIRRNTTAAFNVDPTTATGYSTALGRSDRPLPPAGERRELRGDLPVRLQHAGPQPERSVVLALGHASQEAVPARRTRELRVDRRSAQRVRHDQLQPFAGHFEHRSGRDVPRDIGVHRRQHDVRSGRPHRATRVAAQLVTLVGSRVQ